MASTRKLKEASTTKLKEAVCLTRKLELWVRFEVKCKLKGSVSTPSENEKKKEKEGEKVSNLLPPLILSAAPPGARRGMKLIIILF